MTFTKKILLIHLFLIVQVIYSQNTDPFVEILSANFGKGQYYIEYLIRNGKIDETYDLKLLIYNEQNSLFKVKNISGDKGVVSNQKNTIYWYWSKDRENKPIISDRKLTIEKINKILYKLEIVGRSDIKITLDGEYKGPLGRQGSYLLSPGEHRLKAELDSRYETYETVFDLNATGKIITIDLKKIDRTNFADAVTEDYADPYNTRPRTKSNNQNENQSAFQINLFSYEYDTKSETSKYSFLSCGGYGFTWIPITAEKVKIDDNTSRTIYSFGTGLLFKCGGAIVKGFNICLVGGVDYSNNSLFAEDQNDKSKNKDKITNTKYFYGLELQTNFKVFNIFIKLGQTDSKGFIERVLPNKNYERKSNFSTGTYQTIMIGVKILSSSDDLLRLW